MNNQKNHLNRRNFLTKSMSLCALSCIGMCNPSVLSAVDFNSQPQDGDHKFDGKSNKEFTHKQLIKHEYRKMVGFIKVMQKNITEKVIIDILKNYSADVGTRVGINQSSSSSNNSFESFTKYFRPPSYKNTLTLEIVLDTPTVFELKVTECIWAEAFKELDLAGELGHAVICNMDYYWPKAFNPDFKMERTKTLMQGKDCCNHKYINTK
ncbi:MAG: L-2-amino-thiazoline-4-carboxylic acid hydrolase [Salinivirgaceae bacterium]|nr:L-2-amino-thiazoline-4-carboxylic acid hydrolase [Salinivirgaceae bacterium]